MWSAPTSAPKRPAWINRSSRASKPSRASLYTVKVGNKTDDDKYYVSVQVEGNFDRERAPGADETEEDKERLDREFKEKLAKLDEKLAREQAMGAGFTWFPNGPSTRCSRDVANFSSPRPSPTEGQRITATMTTPRMGVRMAPRTARSRVVRVDGARGSCFTSTRVALQPLRCHAKANAFFIG
jgi:hypothetical protein